MREHQVDFVTLNPSHVDDFIAQPTGRPVTALTRNDARYKVRRYLDWLHERNLIGFGASWLRVRGRKKLLPEPAEHFLTSLTPTLEPSTCDQYRGSLRALHDWMEAQAVALGDLNRQHLQRWFQYLHDKGQAPATRVNIIVAVRVYLRSLNDAGLLEERADDLVRNTDLPKLPLYLPRPLEPEADEQLRARLARAHDPYQRGLLLMRNTGLRIGELSSLEYDCLRTDVKGNHFLKVPLGKLKKERLVPLDAQTYQLAQELRQGGRAGRTWLLESVRGCKTRAIHFNMALETAAHGLEIPNGMTSHRLRHTYATSLMSGGMSLMGVMKLLGHRDYRMTLRYTEITLETVGEEYHAAVTKLETRYRLALKSTAPAKLDPDQALSAIIRWVQKRAGDNPKAQRRAERLVKRLKRIREDVGEL
ncbi:tyrosine-type recombinase/integrase [Corallococcus exiguus]|uniref:tyrosine-type recombinase/integrase n=1 Tax=Corallococcus exiguus TaxID=83462 RepID=UPI001493E207|nr:tyrosine-type recombinase/integrase [Corallococcus exiguus]